MNTSKSQTKLLLVDDDPAMIALLNKVIAKAFADEISIEAVTDPLEALHRMEAGRFDILITDLEMPAINGLQLLSFAKQRNPCMQVLFLTGQSCHDALLEALEKSASDYLLKPIDRDLLVTLVQQAMDRQQRWQRALAATWRQQRKNQPSEPLRTPSDIR